MRRALMLATVALWLAAPADAVENDEVLPTDPRVIEANALLGDDSQRERAIRLYAEVVGEQPDHEMARMWLARVLAWDARYDASLVQYDWFLARPSPPDWAAIERAEVLSWAGRTEEAEAAFEAVLAADPANARAARGLARVYRWSGRDANAAATYERALALEEDAEARAELEALRSKIGTSIEQSFQYFRDSDNYSRARLRTSVAFDLDFSTRLLAESTLTRIEFNRSEDPSLPTTGEAQNSEAFDAMAGIEHRVGERIVLRALVGGRTWQDAPDRPLVRAEAQIRWLDGVSSGLEVVYEDSLSRTDSVDAVIGGVVETRLRAWTWAQLAKPVALYAYQETGILDDGNERVSGGASFDWTPWPELGLRLYTGGDLLAYTDDSVLYYDPTLSADLSFGAVIEREVLPGLTLDVIAGGGYGVAKQDGTSGTGMNWRVEGGVAWQIGRLRLGARGHRSVSQRAQEYRTWGVGGLVGFGF